MFKPDGRGFIPGRLARLTERMQAFVDSGTYAGVVTRVWRDGRLVHEDCVGWMDVAARRPMRRDAIFRIASMTKPIVSTAALMLMEEGRLRLGDPITKWLPEFADVRVLRTPTSPLDDTVPLARPITVLDLLTHRSGVPYDFNTFGELNAAIIEVSQGERKPPTVSDAWLARLAKLPLMIQPGVRWQYGYSTDLLGVLVGRAHGSNLGDALQAVLFEPLGMVDTGFCVPREKLDRLTTGYARDPQGGLVVHDDPAASHFARPQASGNGGGGLTSTADDYLRFARMLLGQGEVDGVRLLGRKTVEAMTRNWLSDEQRPPVFPEFDYLTPHGFGLGVSVVDADGRDTGLASPGKFGWPGAYTTRWFADPKEGLVAVMMTQMWFDMLREIGPAFDTLVYQALE
jgi:CubicO group peptidase (beta-lactamase class C family)